MTNLNKINELFISFFAKRRSLLNNSRDIPLNLHFLTEKLVYAVNLYVIDIKKINFALTSLKKTAKKGLFCTADSNFSYRFSSKDQD